MTTGHEPPAAPERARQAQLVESLRNPTLYDDHVDEVRIVETHISYVLLTGRYAYKIKKAVNLQFLNFETLAARRLYCDEELRLNRPLAPTIYMDVVAITGRLEAPTIGGAGPVLEYAVRMHQFEDGRLLSDVLGRGELTTSHIDSLAADVAAFHGQTAIPRPGLEFGRPEDILEPAVQNVAQLLAVVKDAGDRSDLQAVLDWTHEEHTRCTPFFVERLEKGFVRECHGDLHLGNVALIDNKITLFDRIEFNASMRWIDVMNDMAFLVMDLQDRGRPDLAARFLNAYLEHTGDYDGLRVLRFYLTYRAMVRAKVARLRLEQLGAGAERDASAAAYTAYLNLARKETQPSRVAMIIMHGVAGSGKTTCSDALIASIGAIRIRSDVERKRLGGLGALTRSGSAIGKGIYAEETTRDTYARIAALAHLVTDAGYTVVADAAFLKRWQRDLLRNMAAHSGVPFVIMACAAPVATLRARILQRLQRGDDASEATGGVLDAQLAAEDPLESDEEPFVIHCGTITPESCAKAAHMVDTRIRADPAPVDPIRQRSRRLGGRGHSGLAS